MIARTRSVLTFVTDGGRGRVDMPRGTDLEIVALEADEAKACPNRIGCVAATWEGLRRVIPASELESLDVEAARALKAAQAAARRKAA